MSFLVCENQTLLKMVNRYFIYLSYDGSSYCGWQIQPNGISIQEVVQKALSLLLQEEISIVGAGRTDSGVHAKMMVAHFDTAANFDFSSADFISKLNSLLPHAISAKKIVNVKNEAHARFDAISRTYEYHIIIDKNPFLHNFAMRIFHPLNIEKMNEASQVLLKYTDFTSFSKLHTDVKTNNCKIMVANWHFDGEKYVFSIQADRFLRNMVRAIVGTLIDVGKEKISIEKFKEIIELKNRCKAGASVPAKGLYLIDVHYPDTLFL